MRPGGYKCDVSELKQLMIPGSQNKTEAQGFFLLEKMPSPPSVQVEFAGGVELLFDNTKKITVPLGISGNDTEKENTIHTLRELMMVLKKKYLKQRPELFLQGDSVRPGILVVINECDWELMGGPDYVLSPGDIVVFISTLHGG